MSKIPQVEQTAFDKVLARHERALKSAKKKKAQIEDQYQHDMGLIDGKIEELEINIKALKQK
tara:strand:- start:4113 stop:4298 length:186 start_codon:yes stop_codon:yes gene_type:complete